MATPPSASRVLQWAPRTVQSRVGGRATSGLGTAPSWSIGEDARTRRENAAALWGGAHTGTSPGDIEGAIYLMGDQPVVDKGREENIFGPEPILNQVFQIGSLQAMVYEDEMGQINTTTSEYYEGEAGEWLEEEGFYDERGYRYGNTNPASNTLTSTVGTDPAPITLAPTSSTRPERPRTVAAGYDGRRKVLTVVFRDGTFYNYYEVNALEWWNFVRARSKGGHIKAHLDGKMRGAATTGSVPIEHREALYRLARTAQRASGGYNARQSTKSRRGGKGTYGLASEAAARRSRKARAKAAKGFSSLGSPRPPGTVGP